MLSAGFLFSGGGGAVAMADTGVGDSSPSSPAADAGRSTVDSTSGVTDALPGPVRHTLAALDSLASASTSPSAVTSADSESDAILSTAGQTAADTASDEDLHASDAVALDASTGNDATSALPDDTPTAAVSGLSAARQSANPPAPVVTPDVAARTELAAAPSATHPRSPGPRDSAATAPPALRGGLAPLGSADASRVDAVTLVTRAITSLEDVVAAVGDGVSSVPALLASLPTSLTPITDVITAIQKMLTSIVTAATPLVRLPSDFASMFVVGTGEPMAMTGAPDGRPHGLRDWVQAPVTSVLPQAPAAPTDHLAVASGNPVRPDAPKTIAASMMSNHVALSTMTSADRPIALNGGLPGYLKRIANTLLVPVSLWALVTAAVPGIAGLLTFGFIGVRIGYRQAKANFVMRASAIGRFAGSGPLGVVRSGSLITLRPRVARPTPTMRWQDQAA